MSLSVFGCPCGVCLVLGSLAAGGLGLYTPLGIASSEVLKQLLEEEALVLELFYPRDVSLSHGWVYGTGSICILKL